MALNALNLCKIYDKFNAKYVRLALNEFKLCKIYTKYVRSALQRKIYKRDVECVELMYQLRPSVDLT